MYLNAKMPLSIDSVMDFSIKKLQAFKPNFKSMKDYIFPLVPKSVGSFVTYLFWHSLFFTASTPLARIFRGRWMGVASIQTVVNNVPGLDNAVVRSIVGTSNATIYGDAQFLYADEKDAPGIDRAFGLHAFFGLLWLLFAFLQMVPIRKINLAMHGKFGYITIAVFLGHMLAALNNLIFDEAKHSAVNRIGLGSLTFVSSTYMVLSILAAKNHDIPTHTDYAIRCFLYSIEGAGTIRQVAYMQWLLAPYVPSIFAGPGECQLLHMGQATNCVVPYFIRGIFVRLLTLYYIGLYEHSKKKTSNFKKIIWNENLIATFCTIAFLVVDQTANNLL